MTRRTLAGLTCAALLALPGTGAAQRYVSLSFSSLGLGVPGVRSTDIAADATNRIWITTTEGVSAVLGGTRAPFFPFRANDGLLENTVTAVTFARVSNEERFFLGFPTGIQWGRVLATSGLSLDSPDLVIGAPTDPLNAANELASIGSGTVWSAALGGLVEWDLGGQTPSEGDRFLQSVSPISHVAVAPWEGDPAAIASADRSLYLVRGGGATNPSSFDTRNNSIVDLTFDNAGNLWALTSGRDVVRYNAVPTTGPLDGTIDAFRFTAAQRTVTSLAVDPFTNTVWLGTDLGAYYQTPQAGLLAQDLCSSGDTSGIGCWSLDTATGSAQSEQVDVVYADPSGNTWFGTFGNVGSGIKGRIVRLLLLDQTNYLGDGATATTTLEDLARYGNNGIPGETAQVDISVGSGSETRDVIEDGDTGRFTLTVRLSDLAPVPGATPVPVTAEYAFDDAQGAPRTLIASATWAKIEDFQDDLWIGGPCFLQSLER